MKNILYISILLILYPLATIAQQKPGLPPNISQFIESHFPKHEIRKYKYDKDDGEYEIDLNSGHEIQFDRSGNWIKIKGEYAPIPKSIIDMLPGGIIQYISNNYPRKAIIYIKRKSGYKIELSNSVELKFDNKGNFLKKD